MKRSRNNKVSTAFMALFKRFTATVSLVVMLGCGLGVKPQANSALPNQDAATWAVEIGRRYDIVMNVPYIRASPNEARLDVYLPRNATASAPAPTVIYLHGGGWQGGLGVRSIGVLRFLPYLEMGLAVVNVDFRNGLSQSVEDSRCALRWIISNAQQHNLDVNKIILTGDSSGGHLSLTTGMLPVSAGLDGQCSGSEELKVAAIVNWYGVTDLVDLLEGANQRSFATRWLNGPNAKEVARRLSPVEYVRAGLPPIMTIHGDADSITPYSQAVRLHKALEGAKVPNQLLTIRNGDHGGFTHDEYVRIYATIREFLKKQAIVR